jgi:hypothetical protein
LNPPQATPLQREWFGGFSPGFSPLQDSRWVEAIDRPWYTAIVLWQLAVRGVGGGRPRRKTATVFKGHWPGLHKPCGGLARGLWGNQGIEAEVSQVSYPARMWVMRRCTDTGQGVRCPINL